MLVGPDCLGPGLDDLLLSAAGVLDVAAYEIGPHYAGLLATAAERGTGVRLLADDHTGALDGALRRLRGVRGVDARVTGGRVGERAHWKLIRSSGRVAVGTGNLEERDAPDGPAPRAGTREVWVVVTGHDGLARDAAQAFDAAWGQARRPGEVAALVERRREPPVRDPGTNAPPLTVDVEAAEVRLHAGPAAAGARALAAGLASARRRSLVTVPYVHSGATEVRALLDLLAAAASRGVDVRLLLGVPPGDDPAAAGPAELTALGVPARVMDPGRTTAGHAKVAVVDDTLMCGSHNWSRAGLGANLEALVTVRAAVGADHVARVFESDWRSSV